MSTMQIEAIKAKEQYKQEILHNQMQRNSELENVEKLEDLQQKIKKPKKIKPNKKKANLIQEMAKTAAQAETDKAGKSKKLGNGSIKSSSQPPSTALTSLLIFLLMVAFNVVLIYMIMFKNPEIAEKIVESIPHQYRDWILTKTEIFRLRVTDWISDFRTPPEEH